MAADYDHKAIEKKWQEEWAKQKLYETPDAAPGKENFYALVEFPYPSGDLHVGHWYAFAVPDAFVRMRRMQGYNVLYPIGFDAFGLPAENAAIKRGINPREWIAESVERMGKQMRSMGAAFDWSRELTTSTPEYYKWTQWIFLKFFEKGLAERKKAQVNWCPKDQTVLANEQVIDGKCERCDSVVEKRDLEQWFFKITDYADRLVDDLEPLDWPCSIKESQRNWIGRSEGAELTFELVGRSTSVTVFTTRPDTLFGATYVVLAPEHSLVKALTPTNKAEVDAYVAAAKKKTDIDRTAEGKEKTGVKLEGVTAVNPATKEEIPVFVADYVLAHYGTGAVMGVPGHDERDHAFAKKYKLPIKQVVAPYTKMTGIDASRSEEGIYKFKAGTAIIKHWKEELFYVVAFTTGSYGFVGGHVEEGETPLETARREATEESGYSDVKEVAPILEYSFSRGYKTRKAREEECCDAAYFVQLGSDARVEIVDTETKKGEWMTAAQILALPTLFDHHKLYFEHYISGKPFTGSGKLVNSGSFDGLMSEEAKAKITEFAGGKLTKTYKMRDWLISRQRYWGAPIPIVYDPEGKAHAIPDEHLPWLLPEDADIQPKGTSPLGSSKELIERTEKIFGKGWRPETDTMDGFVDNSWYFLRYLDPHNDKEFSPIEKQKKWMPIARYSGGAEHTTVHVLYSRFFTKVLCDMGLTTVPEPYTVRLNRGIILAEDGRKMSKRWGNVVNPDEQVEVAGADAVRTYLAFIGPYNEIGAFPWSTNGLVGVRRFLERVAGHIDKVADTAVAGDLETLLNQTVKKVGEDIESMKFNTSVSQLMILSNALGDSPQIPRKAYEILLTLLAPFAPHLTEELWHNLGHTDSVHTQAWPSFDSEKLVKETVSIAIQVAGKTKGVIEVARGAEQSDVVSAARSNEKTAKHMPENPSRVVFIKDRILNLIP